VGDHEIVLFEERY